MKENFVQVRLSGENDKVEKIKNKLLDIFSSGIVKVSEPMENRWDIGVRLYLLLRSGEDKKSHVIGG